jgi:hypothetical protein
MTKEVKEKRADGFVNSTDYNPTGSVNATSDCLNITAIKSVDGIKASVWADHILMLKH